jgi:hypothetical protein
LSASVLHFGRNRLWPHQQASGVQVELAAILLVMRRCLGASLLWLSLVASRVLLNSQSCEAASSNAQKRLQKALSVKPAKWSGDPFASLTPICRQLMLNRLRFPGKVPTPGRPHRFSLPIQGSRTPAMLCVPQKNGNRYSSTLPFSRRRS